MTRSLLRRSIVAAITCGLLTLTACSQQDQNTPSPADAAKAQAQAEAAEAGNQLQTYRKMLQMKNDEMARNSARRSSSNFRTPMRPRKCSRRCLKWSSAGRKPAKSSASPRCGPIRSARWKAVRNPRRASSAHRRPGIAPFGWYYAAIPSGAKALSCSARATVLYARAIA